MIFFFHGARAAKKARLFFGKSGKKMMRLFIALLGMLADYVVAAFGGLKCRGQECFCKFKPSYSGCNVITNNDLLEVHEIVHELMAFRYNTELV